MTNSELLGSTLFAIVVVCPGHTAARIHARRELVAPVRLTSVRRSSYSCTQMACSRAIAKLVCLTHPFTCTDVGAVEQKNNCKKFPQEAKLCFVVFPSVPHCSNCISVVQWSPSLLPVPHPLFRRCNCPSARHPLSLPIVRCWKI